MADDGITDSQLLELYVREQDALAFHCLVSRHGPAVHRICRGVLRNAHDAEDAAQETFLLLSRKARKIQNPELLRGWLRGVAYRVAIRARRQAALRRELEKMQVETFRDFSVLTREVPVWESREVISEELTRLPEDYRRPIMLCYLDGLTHQEVARRLGCPLGTVKVRLVRGRRLLRRQLEDRVAKSAILRPMQLHVAHLGAPREPFISF